MAREASPEPPKRFCELSSRRPRMRVEHDEVSLTTSHLQHAGCQARFFTSCHRREALAPPAFIPHQLSDRISSAPQQSSLSAASFRSRHLSL